MAGFVKGSEQKGGNDMTVLWLHRVAKGCGSCSDSENASAGFRQRVPKNEPKVGQKHPVTTATLATKD